MPFLHYCNLPNVRSDEQAKMLMERADNGFWEMQTYLSQAIDFFRSRPLYVKYNIINEKEEKEEEEQQEPNEELELIQEMNALINEELAEENKEGKDNNDKNILESKEKEEELALEKELKDQKTVFVRLEPHPDYESGFIDIFRSFMRTKYVYESTSFKKEDRIRVVSRDTRKYILELTKRPTSDILYIENNTYNLECQKKAILTLKSMPDPDHYPLLKLIDNKNFIEWAPFNPTIVNNWYFLTEDGPGTDVQKDFVKIALATPDFAILEGPPGTGKTITICELIMQVVKAGGRVLLCASTHVAVDNVLENFVDKGYQEVNPVRIGDLDDLSPKIKKFQYDIKKKTLKKELLNFLKSNQQFDSQKYLYNVLSSDDKDKIITNIILDNANLVCGTTIGFLQHPMIKTQQKRFDSTFRGAKPIFDLLIIDEASKTTFNEFLVPALFAKKWILVGDPKQLSPYVEIQEVESNLMDVLPENDQQLCLELFNISQKKNIYALYSAKTEEEIEKITLQAKKLNLDLFRFNPNQSIHDMYKAKIIIGLGSELQKFENYLPPDINYYANIPVLDIFTRRNNLWFKKNGKGLITFENKKWFQEVAWRIVRSYELRLIGKEEVRYEQEIEQLLPTFLSEQELRKIKNRISTINRIALPSIIELLQMGIKSRNTRYGSTLTDGFNTNELKYRHRILQYQHRMHPDISRFPRTHIYDQTSLLDPVYITKDREWTFNRYKNRCVWIHAVNQARTKAKINENEIAIILEELNEFIKYTNSQPQPPDKKRAYWEVAILTFYLEQESAIRKQLRKIFHSGNFQHFWTKNRRVHIQLCTVDRFQGHEAEIVYLSFVKNSGLGFLNSPNRLNVSLTRARYQLVIIGNNKHFKEQKNYVFDKSDLLMALANEVPLDLKY